jgi:hypothetical protein
MMNCYIFDQGEQAADRKFRRAGRLEVPQIHQSAFGGWPVKWGPWRFAIEVEERKCLDGVIGRESGISKDGRRRRGHFRQSTAEKEALRMADPSTVVVAPSCEEVE